MQNGLIISYGLSSHIHQKKENLEMHCDEKSFRPWISARNCEALRRGDSWIPKRVAKFINFDIKQISEQTELTWNNERVPFHLFSLLLSFLETWWLQLYKYEFVKQSQEWALINTYDDEMVTTVDRRFKIWKYVGLAKIRLYDRYCDMPVIHYKKLCL